MTPLALLAGAAWALAPRAPLPKRPVVAPPMGDAVAEAELRLVVKLVDEVHARADARGRLAHGPHPDAAALADLSEGWRIGWRPLLDVSPDRVEALRARAAARTGRAQPDLLGMHVARVPGADAGELEALGEALQVLDVVEWAEIERTVEPPPGDLSPTTPDYSGSQTYAGPDPGIDAVVAAALGATGGTIRLTDVEYGWITGHEDLVDIPVAIEAGMGVPSWVASYGWDHHGTAVLGETSAPDNGYGVTGLVPDSKPYGYPEYDATLGSRRAAAITSAAADSLAGDVVLLEMQTSGESGYGPAELNASVWSATRTAVDAGVVVVAAAGNGSQDLDNSYYTANYLSFGDSGAILVGAGTANTSHDRLGFSTYGSRVDVQGWGQSVFTLGYGSYATLGGDRQQTYTAGFSGTSSASPIVAAAAVAVQDFMVQRWGVPLDPEDLRDLLIATGVPQGSGGHIGPLPDLAAALDALDSDGDGDRAADWGGDDCDDADASVGPSSAEVWYDGVDGDCDGASDFDADGDGWDSDVSGGADCDDADPNAHPGAADTWYDGVDTDCAGDSDWDADLDGYDAVAGGGADCDDTDPAVAPGALEVWYDGVDGDCDGASDFDLDGDGADAAAHGGGDCDDGDPAVGPHAVEVWYDGVDGDCDGASDLDADGDGHDAQAAGGDDCDDTDPAVSPSAAEVWYDGVDGDCDGASDLDADRDGFESASYGGTDCDDADAATAPGATETWYDGVDGDCDGADDDDADGDGFRAARAGGEDCDDRNAAVFPGATDIAGDGLDADCDGEDAVADGGGGGGGGSGGGKAGCDATGGAGGWAGLALLGLLRRRRRR